MATTNNTTKAATTTKRPAATSKPATAANKSVASKPATSNASTADKDKTQHIADQIKVFPSRRVWPD